MVKLSKALIKRKTVEEWLIILLFGFAVAVMLFVAQTSLAASEPVVLNPAFLSYK
ncbi:hypothetical protein JCM19037_165 [Geomicrobium sp. JCM 19037]|uniref:hypothetical protein n=1 Tax=unclassified Geomicrobium TaxID=2628951 RepID=UPI00045F4D42|nr:hypothetical protein [Geomicrobium sp. JCM 19037]GAK01967.1 hypothetical protein JCM19037_165 [Geomicrobium sp. JCM 19037]